jgi:hypothetical protein
MACNTNATSIWTTASTLQLPTSGRMMQASTHCILANLSFKIVAYFMHMTMRIEIDVPREDNVDKDVHIDVDGDFNDGGADQQQSNEKANAMLKKKAMPISNQ